jgi:hypothetical protein
MSFLVFMAAMHSVVIVVQSVATTGGANRHRRAMRQRSIWELLRLRRSGVFAFFCSSRNFSVLTCAPTLFLVISVISVSCAVVSFTADG